MSFDKKFQNRILMDVMGQHYDEEGDLVRFVQKRTGKIDVILITLC